MNQKPKNLPINQKWTHLSHLCSLIGDKHLKERHLLNRLSAEDIQIVDNALGIMRQKFKENGKGEADLGGRVRDAHSFVGLSSELFWCHRLTRLGYSFNLESESGGPDFRIVLDQRTQRNVYAEVKTLQKGIGSNEESDLYSRLMHTINKQIKGCHGIFLIRVQIRRSFSIKTIKPLAVKIQECLQKMNHSEKKEAFTYPADTYKYNLQAEVTISRDVGEKTSIMVQRPAMLLNDAKLLERILDDARNQFNKDNINVVFIDKTFHSTFEDEDIQDALYGKLTYAVSFDENSGEPNSVDSFRRNNGFYCKSSRISAVMVYQRHRWGMSGIQDANIYPHPESCKLIEAEMKALERLSGC